jgi:alpha-tubulin suppressor-like RCC1 family protein
MGDDAYGEFGDGSRQDGTSTTWSTSGPPTVSPQTAQTPIGEVALIGAASHDGYTVKSDGTVWAWGSGGTGRLGNGTTTASYVPVQVFGLTNVVSIAGGTKLSYAVDSNGQLWRWGQLTTSAGTTMHATPEQVVGACAKGVSVLANAVGGWELRADGTLWRLDEVSRAFRPVYGINGIRAVGGSFVSSYAIR